jgi:hypothetical protein
MSILLSSTEGNKLIPSVQFLIILWDSEKFFDSFYNNLRQLPADKEKAWQFLARPCFLLVTL